MPPPVLSLYAMHAEMRSVDDAIASHYMTFFRQEGQGGGYGSRKIVLAISSGSQDLLNRHMLHKKGGLVAAHSFAPTCSINAIEAALKEEYVLRIPPSFIRLLFDLVFIYLNVSVCRCVWGGAYFSFP